MALNTSIISGIRPVQIEQTDPVAQFGKGLQLKSLLTQQQVADQGIADDKAQREAFAQSGGDQSKYLQALASGGNYKAYQAAQKASLDTDKARADIAHLGGQTANQNAMAGKTIQETKFANADRHARDLVSIRTTEEIPGYIDAGITSGVFPAAQRDQMIQKAMTFPGGVDAWRQAQMQAAIPVLDRYKVEAENSRNAATNKTSRDNNTDTNATSRANNAATVAATRDGHKLTNDRAKEANGKAPSGYIWGPAGPDGNPTLIAAKGGPADLKMAGALNQDTQALSGSTNSFDRLAVAANEVLNHPGLKGITGFRGAIPNAPGTDSANAEALLGTLKSQVGFGVLQDMRNNSKTGGALGSVSDAEGKRLEANLAALDKSQSLEQFKSNLQKIITYSEGAKGRLREAYNLKHGAGSTNPARGSGDAPGTVPPAKPPDKTNAGATVSNW